MMIEPRFKNASIVSLAIAFASPATLAAAQAPQSGQHAPPPAAGSAANPSSDLPAQTQTALRLAGLVTFVANSCPGLKPNYARFEAAINALGVGKADLDRPDLKAGYIGYAARYNADVKTSCQRAETQFGPAGTTLADIFERRTAK